MEKIKTKKFGDLEVRISKMTRVDRDSSEHGRYDWFDEEGNVFDKYIMAENLDAIRFLSNIQSESDNSLDIVSDSVDTMEGIIFTDKYSRVLDFMVKHGITDKNRPKREVLFVKFKDTKSEYRFRHCNKKYCRKYLEFSSFDEFLNSMRFVIYKNDKRIESFDKKIRPTARYFLDMISGMPEKVEKELISILIDIQLDQLNK